MAKHTDFYAVDFMMCVGCGSITFKSRSGEMVEIHLAPDIAVPLAHELIVQDYMSDIDDDDGEDEPEPETPIVPQRELVLVD
jgi:hypothetical protein